MEDRFNFFVPLDFEKGKKSDKAEDKYKDMTFEGIASTNDKDSEGETLEPSGYEIQRFLKHGLFNLEHFPTRKKDGTGAQYWVGEPTAGHVKDNQFFVKGKLWSDSKAARSFWDTMEAMKKSGSTRKPGMSIEGQALARDPLNPKRITKSRITNIALTMTPVNTNSFVDICKGEQSTDFIDYDYETTVNVNGESILFEIEDGDKTYEVKKDFSIVEKNVTTATIAPTTSESLDKKPKVVETFKDISKAIELGLLKKDEIKDKIDKYLDNIL